MSADLVHQAYFDSFRCFAKSPSVFPFFLRPIDTDQSRSPRATFSIAFKWNIYDFEKQADSLNPGDFVDSEHFNCGGVKWFLRLYPKGYKAISQLKDDAHVNVGLFLGKVNDNQSGETVIISEFHLFILDHFNDREVFGQKCIREFPNPDLNRDPITIKGTTDFVALDNLLSFQKDALTIGCELTWYGKDDSFKFQISDLQFRRYGDFFNDSNYSDFEIKVCEKSFYVCKLLLAQHSPVFEAMFRTKSRETIENCMHIDDIDETVFEEVLKFLYTKKMPLMDLSTTKEWLCIVDRYDFSMLKELLVEELISQLEPENAVEVFMTAELFQEKKLKEESLKYIIEHLESVINTRNYERPEVLSELLTEELIAQLKPENAVEVFMAADSYKGNKLKEESLKYIVEHLESILNTRRFERPEVHKFVLLEVLRHVGNRGRVNYFLSPDNAIAEIFLHNKKNKN